MKREKTKKKCALQGLPQAPVWPGFFFSSIGAIRCIGIFIVPFMSIAVTTDVCAVAITGPLGAFLRHMRLVDFHGMI